MNILRKKKKEKESSIEECCGIKTKKKTSKKKKKQTKMDAVVLDQKVSEDQEQEPKTKTKTNGKKKKQKKIETSEEKKEKKEKKKSTKKKVKIENEEETQTQTETENKDQQTEEKKKREKSFKTKQTKKEKKKKLNQVSVVKQLVWNLKVYDPLQNNQRQEKQILNTDLTQSFDFQECWINEKSFEKVKNSNNNTLTLHNITTSMNVQLPLRITRSYWDRHGLSLQDIMQILSLTPLNYLWILVTGFNLISTSFNVVKGSSLSPHDVQYSGGRTAPLDLLQDYLESFYPYELEQQKLSTEQEKQSKEEIIHRLLIPSFFIQNNEDLQKKQASQTFALQTHDVEKLIYPVPIHPLSTSNFSEFESLLKSKTLYQGRDVKWYTSQIYMFSNSILWNNEIECIPVATSAHFPAIYVMRILPYDEYVAKLGTPSKPIRTPIIFFISSVLYCSVDESFYVYCAK
jgi:hypothetical protein